MSNQVVSIIIINAGAKNYFAECLESVKKQTFSGIEIISIDNRERRLSYCQALNKGINLSKGNFILCLNDDVVLDKRFIEEGLKGFLINPGIGMVSGKILRQNGKIIDSTGLFLTPWRTARERGYGLADTGRFQRPGYIFGVSGSVAFYRKEMLDKIKEKNYFDERFGFFYEDLDIAWRAQRIGWKGYYIPTAIAWHVRGGTVRCKEGIDRPLARRFLNDRLHLALVKNRYFAIKKNESYSSLAIHLPAIALYDFFVWSYILFFRPRLIKLFLFENMRRN